MKHTLKFEISIRGDAQGSSYACPIEASKGYFAELADEVEPTQTGISLTLNCMSKLAGFLSKNASRHDQAMLRVTFDGEPVLVRNLSTLDFFNRFTLVHRSGLVAQSIAKYLNNVLCQAQPL